jgi:hypothetical protein
LGEHVGNAILTGAVGYPESVSGVGLIYGMRVLVAVAVAAGSGVLVGIRMVGVAVWVGAGLGVTPLHAESRIAQMRTRIGIFFMAVFIR